MNIDKIIREEIQKIHETAGKNVSDKFFEKVLQTLGTNSTPEKLRFFKAWQSVENTDAKNNPLATTWDKQVPGQSDFNTAGVKSYPSEDVGVSATVNTLAKTTNYTNIVNKLKQDDITAEELAAETAELDKWGTGGAKVAKKLGSIPQTDDKKSLQILKKPDEELIDTIQNWLDIAGFVPVVGDAIDIINGLIYFIRGQYINAALSAIALIPVVGSVVAVPLRVAFKSAKRASSLSPALIKTISSGGPGMQKVLLNLVQKGEIKPSTLRALSKSKDDVATLIRDASKKLENIPGGKDISKRTDDFGRYVDSLFKEIDDAATIAEKQAGKISDLEKTIKSMSKNRTVNLVKDLVFSPITVPLKVIRRLIGKKTFRNFTDPDILNGMQKSLNSKYVSRLTKGQGFDAMLKRVTFNETKMDDLLDFVNKSNINLGITPAEMAQLTPGLKNERVLEQIMKLPSNERASILNHMTNNPLYGDFNKYFKGYKKMFITQEMTKLRNLSLSRGAKRTLINTQDKLFSNVNVPKGFAKMYTIGELLEDAENPTLREIGQLIAGASYNVYDFMMITSIADPNDEQDRKELITKQKELDSNLKKLEGIPEILNDLDVSKISESDLELFNMISQINE